MNNEGMMKGGGLAHCTLPPHGISLAVKHKTIGEIWYFIEGHGQVWRKQGKREEAVDVGPGTCELSSLRSQLECWNSGMME